MDHSPVDASKTVAGTRDQQTVAAGGVRATLPKIAGVQIVELGNVLTRSGSLLASAGLHCAVNGVGVLVAAVIHAAGAG